MRTERIGFAMCGSFCNRKMVLEELEKICREYETVIPILSEQCQTKDTRFGTAAQLIETVERLTGQKIRRNVVDTETIGSKKELDALVIAPCTGNTLAKLAHAVTDNAVTMAAKAHLRNERPVVVALATNDGLSGTAPNLGQLLNRNHYYFVPFGQDDAMGKPRSLIADFSLLLPTLDAALQGKQFQPMLV